MVNFIQAHRTADPAYGNNTSWTTKKVAARIREAALTLRHLDNLNCHDIPSGFRCSLKIVVHEHDDAYGYHRPSVRPDAPDQAKIKRADEVIDWTGQWLELWERNLVWARAFRAPWKKIEATLDCSRTTAWRHWIFALMKIAVHLNARG